MSDIILIGDRVLIAPDEGERQTKSGLVLPASVAEQDRIRSGHVVNMGPGYLTPNPEYSEGEPWAPSRDAVRYLPLQTRVGDYAFFLRKEAIELTYEERKYLIVPHGAILALIRGDASSVLDELSIEGLIDDDPDDPFDADD